MRCHYESIRENYRRCVEGSNPQPLAFARLVAEQVGLVDKHGAMYTTADGTPCLNKDRKRTTADFNLTDLTEAVLGDRWADVLGLNTQGRGFPFGRLFREESAAPIGPSHLLNVSAWTAAIGGLIDARMLEGYETTDFDFADFFPVRQVKFWNGSLRIPVVIGPSEMAPPVGPGESHPDARVDAMWVEAQGPIKYGLKATVTKESAFVDITNGEVLNRALDIGRSIKYREHDLTLNAIVGLTNNFRLGLTGDAAATGYNTYGPTVPAGIYGQTVVLNNDLVDPMTNPFDTFNASDVALTKFVNPVNGLPMPFSEEMETILLPSTMRWWAQFMMNVPQLTIGTIPGAPVPVIPDGTFPTQTMTGNNPWAGRFSDVKISQYLYTKHTAPTTSIRPTIPVGLGLSDTNAQRFYRLDKKNFACRMQAWDMQSIDLAPNGYVMADQGLVAGRVANIATAVQVLNPWKIQRLKVS